jgi:phosphohistidine phosphatase SixA
MTILLVRHAERAKEHGSLLDSQTPLTSEGKRQAAELRDSLKKLQFNCDIFLSSEHVHAAQTASILSERSLQARILALSALTPHNPQETLDEITAEAEQKGQPLEDLPSITVVGHEPRLGQLFQRLTSTRMRPLENCEAVCVSGSWRELVRGKGRVEFRTPVVADESGSLEEKIHRKMEVSVFLAGFTIPALVEVIKDEAPEMSLGRAVSAVALTLSLALYVAAVYIYDELSMPEGFWAGVWFRAGSRSGRKFGSRVRRFGVVYAHMIRAWTHVFTPGVICSGIGFLALFWDTDLHLSREWTGVACVVAIAAVRIWYWRLRPQLAVD